MAASQSQRTNDNFPPEERRAGADQLFSLLTKLMALLYHAKVALNVSGYNLEGEDKNIRNPPTATQLCKSGLRSAQHTNLAMIKFDNTKHHSLNTSFRFVAVNKSETKTASVGAEHKAGSQLHVGFHGIS